MSTISMPLQAEKRGMLYLLTVLGCIGGLLFGYDTGIISGALVSIESDFEMSTVDKEVLVSLTVAGAFISSVLAGSLGDNFGRRAVVLASSITFITGALLMGFAQRFSVLLLGRFVVGLGVGSASLIVPIYLAECAPSEHRGTIVACVNLAVTLGQVVACLVAAVYVDTSGGWRYMLGLAALPAAVQFVGFALFIPESPRYLLLRGKTAVGTLALQRLRQQQDVEQEVADILASLRTEECALRQESAVSDVVSSNPITSSNTSSAEKPVLGDAHIYQAKGSNGLNDTRGDSHTAKEPLREMLYRPTTRRALILGCLLQAGNQLGGINTVMYYGASIFTMDGSSARTAVWLTVGLATCNFCGSCLSSYFQDTLGRRLLTLWSMAGVSFMLAVIAVAFWATQSNSTEEETAGTTSNVSSGTWFLFASICVYLLTFSCGMGSTPWTICSEIYPASVRGTCNSISTGVNWIATFTMSMTFLSITKAITASGAFVLYSAISFLLFIFYFFYLPETKGVRLEMMSHFFQADQWGKQRGCGRVPLHEYDLCGSS